MATGFPGIQVREDGGKVEAERAHPPGGPRRAGQLRRQASRFLNPVSSDAAWYNVLLASDEEHHLEPISGGIENSPKVKLTKVEVT